MMNLSTIRGFIDNNFSMIKKNLAQMTEEEKKITYVALLALASLAIFRIAKFFYHSFKKRRIESSKGSIEQPSDKPILTKAIPRITTNDPMQTIKTEVSTKEIPQPSAIIQPSHEPEIPMMPSAEASLPTTTETLLSPSTETEDLLSPSIVTLDNSTHNTIPLTLIVPSLSAPDQLTTLPDTIPTPPPPPPPPPVLPPPLPHQTPNVNETPEKAHLRREENRLKRSQATRLKLGEIPQEGSLLTKTKLDALIVERSHCEEFVKLKGSPSPDLERTIAIKEVRIKEIDEEIQSNKIYEIKCSQTDFCNYISKLTTDELKLIWGCFQKTQKSTGTPDPLIEFYDTYPDQDMKMICANNQKIYKSLFENCSKLFVDAFKKLIKDRDEGAVQPPIYEPVPYTTTPPQGKIFRSNSALPPQTPKSSPSLIAELNGKFALLGQTVQIPNPANKENSPSSKIGYVQPQITLKKTSIQLSPEKEEKQKIDYMLEKLESLATQATRATFNQKLSDLKEKKESLERSLPQGWKFIKKSIKSFVGKEASIEQVKQEIENVQKQIDTIANERKLAQDYLTHRFREKSNLKGALKHEYTVQFKLEEQAKEYANKKIDEIRRR